MVDYDDLEMEQKNNSRRLDQVRRKRAVAGRDTATESERTGTFVLRMIIVLLVLSVTMFLKQASVLDHSRLYEVAMNEMEKQLTIDDLKETIVDEHLVPAMNWLRTP